jgi:hypothetical protein
MACYRVNFTFSLVDFCNAFHTHYVHNTEQATESIDSITYKTVVAFAKRNAQVTYKIHSDVRNSNVRVQSLQRSLRILSEAVAQ